MPVQKTCLKCGSEFSVPPGRANAAKYCSRTCSSRSQDKKAKANTVCTQCGKRFHIKESQKTRYKRTLGYFCSNSCSAKSKSIAYSSSSNPNYKGRNTDSDGYRIYTPSSSRLGGLKSMKLHQAVCCEILGVQRIGNGLHVHHRDCDIMNNDPKNLAVLGASDHKWLHKQYGVATLWAFMKGKVGLEELISWSDDRSRAKRLLEIDVTMQNASEIGVAKDGELLETPDAGNQQPSSGGNALEGSETSSRAVVGNATGSNAATSAVRVDQK